MIDRKDAAGPLAGLKVVEFAGLGPTPYCGMLLADMGAERIRIERPTVNGKSNAWTSFISVANALHRGGRSICINVKSDEGAAIVRRLLARCDVLLEGFRPGVMEKLGLGPTQASEINPRLVYARMTGWGQAGSLSATAGHDINYLALSGALHLIGRKGQPPIAPPGIFGDFAAGGTLLAFGIVCAVLEARCSGLGQVVDGSVLDAAALTTTMMRSMLSQGAWRDEPGTNVLDGGADFYEVYECADGKYVSVGALEPQFYGELMERLGVDPGKLPDRFDARAWPERKAFMSALFRTRARDDWAALFDRSDACVAPVLSLAESPLHPHNTARSTFYRQDGRWYPAPAPRFSRTSPVTPRRSRAAGQDSRALLLELGYSQESVVRLMEQGVVLQADVSKDPEPHAPDPC